MNNKQKQNIIGIRREDKNIWERRVPLIPSHSRELIQERGVRIIIQPSRTRVFEDEDYRREGVSVKEDLSPCKVILAVKEIPVELIMKGRVYVFFSHTTKGQSQNMPMLKTLRDRGCTLIEYEKITDDKGRRLLFFGIQAGQAGMVEVLHSLGQKWKVEGIDTPLFRIDQPFKYQSLVEIKEKIKKIGWEIYNSGLDPGLKPVIIGFAGYGRTSTGAQELFDLLPHKVIQPSELPAFMESGDFASHRLYKVVFKEEDMVRPKSPEDSFSLSDYYQNPEKYVSQFDRYLPHLTALVNCIYWEPRYPRFITRESLKKLFRGEPSPRLKVIGDISCDIGGSVECNFYSTTPDEPFYIYDPIEQRKTNDIRRKGIALMTIDNLPAEIPLESSAFFSQALKPFIPSLAGGDFSKPFEEIELPGPLRRATVLYQGDFTPDYRYLKKFLQSG
ncbi:MAG: bifunctional lysine ketoglutarate reductase /saccharopine dehydrogenase family protein [Candidatus Aminicenantes bacterium]